MKISVNCNTWTTTYTTGLINASLLPELKSVALHPEGQKLVSDNIMSNPCIAYPGIPLETYTVLTQFENV